MSTPTQFTPAPTAQNGEHTPTPYYLKAERYSHAFHIVAESSHHKAQEFTVCTVSPVEGDLTTHMTEAEAKATAAFIVRACNEYAADKAAIRQLREALETMVAEAGRCGWDVDRARAALESTKELAP